MSAMSTIEKFIVFGLGSALGVMLCGFNAYAVAQADGTLVGNPILRGDHPDPTIIRVGHTYWTTSTSGNWAPEFPLYKSKDLRHWEPVGAVFPQTPAWASGSFWAPELVSDEGRILVYYVARRRDGPLCVAAATAERPKGPYTDHGPMVCQEDGSIDPAFVRDENGQPYLIWKEDGNSQGKPTPIWAQPLTNDLLHVTGSPVQLLVNDPESWEGGVVEAPYMLRHAGRFYLFYAGNACCGTECRYAEGVARADRLAGPWEKNPTNPIIAPNDGWKCPGHGTVVETPKGRDYLIYHAYPASGAELLGRESILDEVTWSADGWPVVNDGKGPGGEGPDGLAANGSARDSTSEGYVDKFRHRTLDPEWRWPVGQPIEFKAGRGRLVLDTALDGKPVFIARSILAESYVAEVGVEAAGAAEAGLGVSGAGRGERVLARHGEDLVLYSVEDESRTTLWRTQIGPAAVVWLRVSSAGSKDHAEPEFDYSVDHTHWTAATPAEGAAKISPLGQGLRVALVVEGAAGEQASFVRFSLTGLIPGKM